RLDGLRIDVGKAQRLAQAVAEQGKSNEAGSRAPFEGAALFRRAPLRQQRDVVLPEARAAAVEMLHVVNADAAEGRGAPPLDAPQPGLDGAVLDPPPELAHS